MMYAGEFLDDEQLQQTAAIVVMNMALNNKSFSGQIVVDLLNKVYAIIDNPDAEYQKEAIRKHLNEMSKKENRVFQLTEEEKKDGFRYLFDGTNLDAWTGNLIDYRIEDGCISLYPSLENTSHGNLFTKEEFANFIYRFEFQLTPGANNGIGIRTPMEGDAAYVGMEIQVLDGEHPIYSNIANFQHHGSVYGIIPAKRGFLKPNGEWNTQEILADGTHIRIILNGEVILDGDIKEATKNGTPDKKAHPGLFNEKGHIGFLGHGTPVKFRNIRIKEIK